MKKSSLMCTGIYGIYFYKVDSIFRTKNSGSIRVKHHKPVTEFNLSIFYIPANPCPCRTSDSRVSITRRQISRLFLSSRTEDQILAGKVISTLCPLGNFSCVFVVCWFFSKSTLSKNSFSNTIGVSNSLDPDQARHSVGPDLGLNCLQRLSADDTQWAMS